MDKASSCVVALALLLLPVARAQRHPSDVVEDSYRGALSRLAAGSLGPAVSRVIELEERSSAHCLQVVELRMAELLASRDPEALVAQALLRIALHETRYQQWRRAANPFEFEKVSMSALRELGDLYVSTSQHRDARSITAGLLTHMAHMVGAARSAPRLEAASDLLEAAVEIDPDHPTARYSLAEALELLGRPVQALEHLDRLLELEPEDPRLRVRRALLTVKSGRLERGQLLLEELTTDGPVWVRDLATQELARLLTAAGRKEEAVALLREGLEELPREKLSLQLAALLDPHWMGSWEVLGAWLDTTQRDSGPSARWIYEDEDGVNEKRVALRRELGSAAAERSAALKSALSRTPPLSDEARRTVAASCRPGRNSNDRDDVPDRGRLPVGLPK
jgi:tetratricopeptide (TPR) repeat protein